MTSKTVTIDDLCEDVLRLLFDKYLDLRTKLRVKTVCKRFYDLIQHLFDGKRALYLTDASKTLHEICDEDITRYSVLSVQDLCQLKDGLWIRGERGGLQLQQPIDIQMLALKNFRHLNALCLVLSSRSQLDTSMTIMDRILLNCPSNLEKLIIINLNGTKFSLKASQMEVLCGQYSNLKHFEIFSDYLYASEECFELMMSRIRSLEVFKANVRQVFNETIERLGTGESRAIIYNAHHFSGNCFGQMSDRMTTIYVSHPVLSVEVIIKRLPQMVDRFANVRHLGVENLTPNSMQTICNVFKNIESLSFSMQYAIESNENQIKDIIDSISRFQNLRQLSIRWFTRFERQGVVAFDYPTLRGLKDCLKLERFVIKEALLGEHSLKVINKVMPRLESLSIIESTINRNAFIHLIDLKGLKQLFVLKSISEQTFLKLEINEMNEQIVSDIANNCIELGLMDSFNMESTHEPHDPNEPQIMDNHILNDEVDELLLDILEDDGPFPHEEPFLWEPGLMEDWGELELNPIIVDEENENVLYYDVPNDE